MDSNQESYMDLYPPKFVNFKNCMRKSWKRSILVPMKGKSIQNNFVRCLPIPFLDSYMRISQKKCLKRIPYLVTLPKE